MNRKSTIFLLTLLWGMHSSAQNDGQKNMAKINLSAIAVKGVGLQYERKVSKHITVAMGYSIIPKSSLAFSTTISNQINDPSVTITDYKLGTSIFTPEVRFYVGKKGAFHGFYLAPYGRFGNYSVTGPVDYYTSSGTERAVFNGSLHTFMGGLLLGSNFKLSEVVYLDWWIIGASIGGASGSFKANVQLPEEF